MQTQTVLQFSIDFTVRDTLRDIRKVAITFYSNYSLILLMKVSKTGFNIFVVSGPYFRQVQTVYYVRTLCLSNLNLGFCWPLYQPR